MEPLLEEDADRLVIGCTQFCFLAWEVAGVETLRPVLPFPS